MRWYKQDFFLKTKTYSQHKTKTFQAVSYMFTCRNVDMLEHDCIVWAPYPVKDIEVFKSAHRHFTQRLPGFSCLAYTERLKCTNLPRLVTYRPHLLLHLLFRSSTNRSCAVPCTHNTFGDRSFAAAGPRVWNKLPAHLRDEDITYSSFRHELKTYWF